jgi:hypothetical protein
MVKYGVCYGKEYGVFLLVPTKWNSSSPLWYRFFAEMLLECILRFFGGPTEADSTATPNEGGRTRRAARRRKL